PFAYTDEGDITMTSCDGVQFEVYRSDLHTHSEIFPGDEFGSRNETVCLSEDAATLALLFQYMSHRPHPDLCFIAFEQLSKLAEAAEKYRVFPAMEACKTSMRGTLPKNAISILAYAARHGYDKIYVEAAPLTLRLEPKKVFEHLGHVFFVHWVRMRRCDVGICADSRCRFFIARSG
ncbi:hypothetical protein FOMPIDRAFT_1130873, partial [Fomitopsis schrenkii]